MESKCVFGGRSVELLAFLDIAADGALSASGNPYVKAFYNIHGGWKEVVHCVRKLLRERAEGYGGRELIYFLRSPLLQKTVSASLWHALVTKLTEYKGDREKLRAMLAHILW